MAHQAPLVERSVKALSRGSAFSAFGGSVCGNLPELLFGVSRGEENRS